MSSPTDSEIKVHYAMVRRGISFQFARLMSFHQHAAWETFLFEALHKEPPLGYQRPSLAQLLQCDKAAFARLGTQVTTVRQRDDGTYPVGEALLALRQDPNIELYLMPLGKSSSAPSPSAPSNPTYRLPTTTLWRWRRQGKRIWQREERWTSKCSTNSSGTQRPMAQKFQWRPYLLRLQLP